MKAPFSLFFALRYLQPKRTFVSLISIINVLGVTLGIGVMIIVISVMTGFDHELRRKVLGFEPHLTATGPEMQDHWRDVEKLLRKTPGVVATAPYVQGAVILSFGNERSTPILRGIDPELEQAVTHLRSSANDGKFDLLIDDSGKSNKVVLGEQLAKDIGAKVGDIITVYAPGDIGGILEKLNKAKEGEDSAKALEELRSMVLPAELVVTGTFFSGRYLYDANYLMVSLSLAQELNGLGDGVQGISMRTNDPNRVEEVKEAIRTSTEHVRWDDSEAPLQVGLRSWIDMNSELFDALHVERTTMFVILTFIIIVAAFSIVNTLITVTTQKTRDIGVMKALGATQGQIVGVFLLFGVIVDLIGTVLGVAFALVVIHYRNPMKKWLADQFHIQVFPASIYQFPEIPATVVPSDVLIICGSALFISALAAFLPAYKAARMDPVKALRFE